MIGILASPVPSSARRSQHASTVSPHTVAYIAQHTNSLLRRKCLPLFTDHSKSYFVWVRRHKAAHKRHKGTCPPPLPAHVQGWLCIHKGEGAWDDAGDPYWGGLQMHPGWGGVHHASDLSPLQQMWLAEHELRKNGYSPNWVSGQWPISSQSCMQYF